MPTNAEYAHKFELDLQRFADEVDKDITAVYKKLAFDLFKEIVFRTPVDTGTLRANWTIGVGTEPKSPEIKLEEKNQAFDYKERETDKKGEEVLLSSAEKLKEFATVYIYNHLPYAEPIENGHSREKAPEGMVKVSIKYIVSGINRLMGT